MTPARQAWIWIQTETRGLSRDTRAALKLAREAGCALRAAGLGKDADAARQLSGWKVDVLLTVDTEEPELAALSLAQAVEAAENPPDDILAPGNAFGRDLMARLAARLGAPLLQDCVAVDLLKGRGEKYLLSGRTLGTFSMPKRLRCWTLRPQVFDADPPAAGGEKIPVQTLPAVQGAFLRRLADLPPDETPPDDGRWSLWRNTPSFEQASIILCGGSALGSPENFALLHALARKLGAAVGATPEAVQQGFAPAAAQIGQTGAVVSPDLYMAFGASGSVSHLAGIRTAGTVVAVDAQPDSTMFVNADYGLLADPVEVLRLLLALADAPAPSVRA